MKTEEKKKVKKEPTPDDLRRKAYQALRRKILKNCKEGGYHVQKTSLEYFKNNPEVSLPSRLLTREQTVDCYEQTINEYIEQL